MGVWVLDGALTVEQARVIAKDWAAEVRRGNDPSAERDRSRKAPMMSDLFDRYLAEHARRTRSRPASLMTSGSSTSG